MERRSLALSDGISQLDIPSGLCMQLERAGVSSVRDFQRADAEYLRSKGICDSDITSLSEELEQRGVDRIKGAKSRKSF